MEEKNNEKKLNLEVVINEESTDKLDIVETKSQLISKDIQTTLTDKKFIFNLNDRVDYKLDDFENKEIVVKDILIKTYIKEMIDDNTKKVKINEITGEIETVKTIVTILIDKDNKSYVTASKFFANRIKQLLEAYQDDKEQLRIDLNYGIKIKIIKNEMPDNKNHRYLTFLWD